MGETGMLRLGLDVGSTTIKLVALDDDAKLHYKSYRRHRSDIRESLTLALVEARQALGDRPVLTTVTGSAGMAVAEWIGAPFVQEVVAAQVAVERFAPATDVVIELGGEDAKITYRSGTPEQRMNGTCAGGTGSFLDQMATLLRTDVAGLDELARSSTTTYPIAARCGVFAKSDVQPLLNEGARKEDIAASIFEAVATQTIGGLAQGRPIRGRVALLGGPLTFLAELRRRFISMLGLSADAAVCPPDGELWVAMGAALASFAGGAARLLHRIPLVRPLPATRPGGHPDAGSPRPNPATHAPASPAGDAAGAPEPVLRPSADPSPGAADRRVRASCRLGELSEALERTRCGIERSAGRLGPLFENADALAVFRARHARSTVERGELRAHRGPCYLGIDAGSTTTKLALIGEHGELLFSAYDGNRGRPLAVATEMLARMYAALPEACFIARAVVTGYGEKLLGAALRADRGEIETIAHLRAAQAFAPGVEFILDIGGQDMKCLRVRGGVIDKIMLNEACSSGCGSFLETFSDSLGLPLASFVQAALGARAPVDLGSRCTVFMNSRVKQAQKEGASFADLAAGLCHSVIRNALTKVIKIRRPDEMGSCIVVQGGTFSNDAVLRCFELVAGREAVRPDIAGLMGAYGAALIARGEAALPGRSSLLGRDEIARFDCRSGSTRCAGCANRCRLTVTTFNDGRACVTGNRCERGEELARGRTPRQERADEPPDLFAYKYRRIFGYRPIPRERARAVVGIPRVLNVFENYPFWFTVLTELGFRVELSRPTTSELLRDGLDGVPADSLCFPAKLAHGHVRELIRRGVDVIFFPSVPYEKREHAESNNHFNCPVVAGYPEVIRNTVVRIAREESAAVDYLDPFVSLDNERALTLRLIEVFRPYAVDARAMIRAVSRGLAERDAVRADLRARGEQALRWIEERGAHGIVLCGRPYHIDPGINHGVPGLITSMGMAVLTEDSIAHLGRIERPLRVVDQWVYHSRLYAAAEFASRGPRLDVVQLTSFGCGLDAVTADQVHEILAARNRIYTLIKIDEGDQLGAARIRLRSLAAVIDSSGRRVQPKAPAPRAVSPRFTRAMRRSYTILAPQMAPIHFRLIEAAFRASGYGLEILASTDPGAVDTGLRYVNNDACYPSILVVGQLVRALQSGRYDPNRTAVMITQTGGGCRATNYVAFLRKALADAGLSHVPVVSLNALGSDRHPGFRMTPRLLHRALKAVVLGDLLMRVSLATRPYELASGSSERLVDEWCERIARGFCRSREACARDGALPSGFAPASGGARAAGGSLRRLASGIVADFERIERSDRRRPRVGVVGEILVKYHPTANNHVVELIEREGGEAVVPELSSFLLYCAFNQEFKHSHLGKSFKGVMLGRLSMALIEAYLRPVRRALANERYGAPERIREIARRTEPHLSLGVQTGEGWLLTGEMIELIESGVPNIVCMQPFACLPNQVSGKGMIGAISARYPGANIVAVDYDPGASEVNQLNRIKLMLHRATRSFERVPE